jgi:hypothetical protein
MRKIERILLPTIILATGGMCFLWVNEQQVTTKLARELQARETELEDVQAARKGLAQANNQLQLKLSTLERTALTVRPNFTRMELELDAEDGPPSTTLPSFEDPLPQSTEDPNTPTILSPEEVAAKKQQEEERAQRDAERTERRREFQERVTTDIQTRRNFFSQINTDDLAPEYQEAHLKLLQAFDTSETLLAQLSNPDLNREERREIGREMWQEMRGMGDLMDMQRDVLLNDYAELSLGMSREQTQEFITYMQTVNEMTSGRPGGSRGGRGR